MYGKRKYAFFDDRVIIGSPRRCLLKHAVRLRRTMDGYRGGVHFVPRTDFERFYVEMDRCR